MKLPSIAGLLARQLLLISLFSGHALSGEVAVPFIKDVEVHTRFLLVLPLLVAAANPGPARQLHDSVEYGNLAMDVWGFGAHAHAVPDAL